MEAAISIVIVNYNVQYFIEQCLNAIFNLTEFDGALEVIVVDNDSSDGSVTMIREKFPAVIVIENKENVGFSIANNQGFKVAKGRYILMLNPDTIIEEDTLQKCYDKIASDPQIGLMGVRMVDGGGKFLPESKRGFPTPLRAFFKFTGLYRLAPSSKVWNGYYFGQVGEMEEAEVEILCGAFMFLRAEDLKEVGYLDESFFMYGEDIDLSYRFKEAGKKVIYFPGTTIIHFKGESTKKLTSQYVKRFYDAMDIFARKHFKASRANAFLTSLSLVIQIKSLLNRVKNLFAVILLPILDLLLILLSLQVTSRLWAVYYFKDTDYYVDASLWINFGLYSIIWLIALVYSGAYDQKIQKWKLVRNILVGTLVILAIYGLLPDPYRSSRAIILLSMIAVLVSVFGLRIAVNFLKIGKWSLDNSHPKRILLIASASNADLIKDILIKTNRSFQSIIPIPPEVSSFELNELIKIHKIDEIICHSKDTGMKKVIDLMVQLGDKVGFKITGDESLGIIGSSSRNTSGEIYTVSVRYEIQDAYHRRLKRTFDVFGSLGIVLLSPLLILFPHTRKLVKGSMATLIGKKSLVGYQRRDVLLDQLPKLKEGIISIHPLLDNPGIIHDLNFNYAKNYTVWEDVRRFFEYIIKQ